MEEEEQKEIYFLKQKHSVQPFFCLNTYISIKKHYKIEEYVLTNAGYKYSDVVNDLNQDFVVTSLKKIVLTCFLL